MPKPLPEGVAAGLSEQYGGAPEKWHHDKGFALLETQDGDRQAEDHWFANEHVGQVRHKVKMWMNDED